MADVWAGFDMVFTFQTVFWVVAGSILGIVLGALPGLTATMGIALMLPISFYLPTATGMAMLLAVYAGAISGASIPAILLGIPGNPNALATVEDGHRMSENGQAGLALGSAVTASLIGGLLSLGVLILFAPLLAKATLAFGPAEKFSLALVGLAVIASIAADDLPKGILAGALGVCLAMIGTDPFMNTPRMPFPELLAMTPLQNGIKLIPALIGLFGISQAFSDLEKVAGGRVTVPQFQLGRLFPTIPHIGRMWRIILESTGIGTLIGAIPGAGASIAVFLSYERAKKITHRPGSRLERVGSGCVEGVFAPEVANNAVTGGALIPVLTLGIPGDAATAVLMGALLVKGVVPGNQLFTEHMPLVYAIFIGVGMSLVAMFTFQLAGVRLYPKILKVPLTLLIPIVIALSFVGTFAIDGQAVVAATFNMGLALALGLVGFLLKKGGYPISPLVLGLILGPMLEENFRLAVKLDQGSYLTFFERPISLALIVLVSLLAIGPRVLRRLRKKP